jgi:hypothetical protein
METGKTGMQYLFMIKEDKCEIKTTGNFRLKNLPS